MSFTLQQIIRSNGNEKLDTAQSTYIKAEKKAENMNNIIQQFVTQFVTGLHHIGWPEVGMIFAILMMDAALSGDNSIAINAMAMDAPEKSRKKLIYCGLLLAAVLRIVALGFASFIAGNPWVQVLGAGYLFYLVYGHFSKGDDDDAEKASKKKASFVGILIAIGFLDLSLSTDNIIAVVAMSSNMAVIVIGVLASIAMLAVAAQVVRVVMGKYPSLEGAAYIILAFLGVMMLAEHGAETIVWIGEKTGLSMKAVAPYHFNLGEVGEIVGVAAIVATAVLKDKFIRPLARH